jgi:hypothetical protein
VVFLLSAFGELSWDLFWGLVIAGFFFKVTYRHGIDTPVLYALVYAARKKFNLGINEEIDLIW